MANTFDIQATLSEVLEVSDQVATANAGSTDERTFGKQSEKYAGLLSDWAERISELSGDSVEEIFAQSVKLGEYAKLITPASANTLWKSDEIQNKIKTLQGIDGLGLLSTDQSASLKTAISNLSKSNGVRGPRTETEAIKDRATRVVFSGGAKGDMAGNKAQSHLNIASRLAGLLEVDKGSDAYKVLKDYARRATQGETVVVPAQDKDGNDVSITLTPYEPEED